MNTGKPDTSRINMALYGGLAGLLANREYLAAEYVVDLSDTELDNLLELSEVASRRQALAGKPAGWHGVPAVGLPFPTKSSKLSKYPHGDSKKRVFQK